MANYCRIPTAVTAVHAFAVVNLIVLLHLTLVKAEVFINDLNGNSTQVYYVDEPSEFGPRIPPLGIRGRLVRADPTDACHDIKPPENISDIHHWIVLVARNVCHFDLKVLNAQRAGYSAVIVYSTDSDELIKMSGSPEGIHIPSVFIGRNDADEILNQFLYPRPFEAFLQRDDDDFDITPYLIPLAVVVGICLGVLAVFLTVKAVRQWRVNQKHRLSRKRLNQLPSKRFKKGDPYDSCAICLDDYDEGDRLRILPCDHVYHMKCVDPWLLNNKRTCPLCKHRVFGEDEEADSSDERTPLISPQSVSPSIPRSRYGTRSDMASSSGSVDSSEQTSDSEGGSASQSRAIVTREDSGDTSDEEIRGEREEEEGARAQDDVHVQVEGAEASERDDRRDLIV